MSKTTIDRRWLPLNALRAFEGVAKHSSFTAAANALLISQSALSRHVIALEKLIGTQLFERKPHALVLTKAGQHLLPAVMKSFDRLEYALDDIRNDGSAALRTLRVQMPPSFAVHLAVPILRDFRRAAAEVEIDLVSYYGVGPPPSDVDVAVLYSKPTVTDMVTDLLWPVHLSVLCHPSVAERYADKSLAEFIESNELLHVRISDLPRHHLWTQFARRSNLSTVNVERGLVFDNVMLAVQYQHGAFQPVHPQNGGALADCVGGHACFSFHVRAHTGKPGVIVGPPEIIDACAKDGGLDVAKFHREQ